MLKAALFIPVVVGLVSVLTSCSAHTASTGGPCNAEAAQSLVGKARTTDAEAMRLTNSNTVRQIEPGQMVTQDFRADRVTIETDPATGQIVGARCG